MQHETVCLRRAAEASTAFPALHFHKPPLPDAYGTHHSKAFLAQMGSGLRLIIHTANLIYPDCNNKTQGVWYQDFPPKVWLWLSLGAGVRAC